MNKNLLFIVFFTAIGANCFAQKNSTSQTGPASQTISVPQLSIGGEFGFPTGQASTVYGSAFGASVKLEVPLANSHFNVAFSAGYTGYAQKFSYAGVFKNTSYIPVEAGGRFYFSKIGYFEGNLGVSDNLTGNYSTSKYEFIYAPGIGFSAPTSKHKATIDIGLRFENRIESGGSIGQAAIRLAYRFGLKKVAKAGN